MTTTTAQPETRFVAEPGTHEMTVIAVIDAPRDKVFRAYTEPDLLSRWWGPPEITTRVETLEARPGGRWRVLHSDDDGNEYGFHGVFHHVVPGQRIVQTFEFDGAPSHVCLETATFEDVEGKTKVTARSVYQSVEDRDAMKDSGAEDFAPVGMAQLAEVVGSL